MTESLGSTFQLVSLSSQDASCTSDVSIIASAVINCPGERFDEKILEIAVGKALDKLRIFAGRLSAEKVDGLRQIRVPLGPLSPGYQTYSFGSQTIEKDLNYPCLNSNESQFFPSLPKSYFQNPIALPSSTEAMIKTQSHFFSIYVTKLNDMVCIGVEFFHGVMDGIGHGTFWIALDEALNDPDGLNISKNPAPIIETENALERNFSALQISEQDQHKKIFESRFNLIPLAFWPAICFIYLELKERWWYKAQHRQIFVGRDLLKGIIAEAKSEVKNQSDSKQFITTNDILMAWFLKSVNENEGDNTKKIRITFLASARAILNLKNYPFTALLAVFVPSIPTNQLNSTPISKTALIIRNAGKAANCFRHLEAGRDFIRKSPKFCLKIEKKVECWGFTNQSLEPILLLNYSNCIKPNLKEEKEEENVKVGNLITWFTQGAIQLSNMFSITEVPDSEGGRGNYFFQGRLRKSRWLLLQKEIELLANQLERD